jgi:hypothetical protein
MYYFNFLKDNLVATRSFASSFILIVPLYSLVCKEIVERRHGEPIEFLFLPKMGLLGSQAGNEKNCWF